MSNFINSLKKYKNIIIIIKLITLQIILKLHVYNPIKIIKDKFYDKHSWQKTIKTYKNASYKL